MKQHLPSGATIDAEAIANGIYEMFSENERACLAFGMLPADKMESLTRMLNEKAETMAKDECQQKFGFRPKG